MADYYTQLVVQQNIPLSLISPFEKLLLGEILECEQEDEETHFFASQQICDFPTVDRTDLQQALTASPQRSRLKKFALLQLDGHAANCAHIDLDFTASIYGSDAHLIILQDIVRRSKGQLSHLTIAAAYNCSKMRPDGFGGMCIVITPGSIRFWSTYQILQDFTARFEKRQAAKRAPPAPPPE